VISPILANIYLHYCFGPYLNSLVAILVVDLEQRLISLVAIKVIDVKETAGNFVKVLVDQFDRLPHDIFHRIDSLLWVARTPSGDLSSRQVLAIQLYGQFCISALNFCVNNY
jgi:hypothetical protein